jgi:TRAP-type transport system periplasmic protein
MRAYRPILAATIAAVLALPAIGTARAVEFTYGSWPPAVEYLNRVALPAVFSDIEKETKGAVKWKLVPGGQLANPKATFQAVQDGLMQAGLGISTYVPNRVPSLNTIYSTVVFDSDTVAASGAALETMTLHCPSCLAEFKKMNAVPLSAWTSSPYQLDCREPVKTLADLKGKRVRATGGNNDLMQLAGAVPVAATLVEAVSLLQRGGLDCTFGVTGWLKAFGYADFAKYLTDYPLGLTGPAIGLMMNRDAWNKLTKDQKLAHMHAAAKLSAMLAIGQFVVENEEIQRWVEKNKGVKVVKADTKEFDDLAARFDKVQRKTNVANAKKFGVPDPDAIIDAYAKAREKWRKLSPGIGRDIGKFTDALWNEVYAKVDPSAL